MISSLTKISQTSCSDSCVAKTVELEVKEMGVPRPCSFDPSCSLEIKGSCYTDSMNTIIEQPLQSMPQTSALQSQPQTPLVCSPNKFSYLNSTEALYATTETVHSGGSVEMWYLCRLLCPRHQCKNIKDSVLQQVDLPEGVVSGAGPDLKRGHTEVTMDPGDDEDERDDLGQNTDEDLAKNSTSRFKDDTSCRNEEDITYTRVINKSKLCFFNMHYLNKYICFNFCF